MRLLEVGDVLTVQDALRTVKYKITRVTKTLAFSKQSGWEAVFKRGISLNMSHPSSPYDNKTYEVEKKC